MIHQTLYLSPESGRPSRDSLSFLANPSTSVPPRVSYPVLLSSTHTTLQWSSDSPLLFFPLSLEWYSLQYRLTDFSTSSDSNWYPLEVEDGVVEVGEEGDRCLYSLKLLYNTTYLTRVVTPTLHTCVTVSRCRLLQLEIITGERSPTSQQGSLEESLGDGRVYTRAPVEPSSLHFPKGPVCDVRCGRRRSTDVSTTGVDKNHVEVSHERHGAVTCNRSV